MGSFFILRWISSTAKRKLFSYSTISANEFINRRAHLFEIIANSSLSPRNFVLLLSKPRTFSAPDVPHVYRQCSYFRYLCGIEQPNFRLLIGPKETVLFAEDRSEHQILWEGAIDDSHRLQQISGINKIIRLSEFEQYFGTMVRDAHLAVDLSSLTEAAFHEPDLKRLCQTLSAGGLAHISINDKIDQLRWQKSPNEQDLMKQTARIASESFNAMFRECRGAENESHVVAGGKNANTIHYITSNKPIRPNDCVLVDAGSDLEGYVSDVTRCFPVHGTFSASQKSLYDALNHVQAQLLHYVKNTRPLRLNELYDFMLERMADSLNSIVFFRKNFSDEELINECDKLCPHHVSHYLGMDVHDTPTIPRSKDCLPGVVITVEPGIYVRPENDAVRDEFKGIGFRIEDDVLLTESGAEILTSNCLRTSDEIEIAMRS